MKKKPKILGLGFGGVAGVLLTRCLKNDFDVYGTDNGIWARKMIEAKPNAYKDPDLIIPVPDSLIRDYAGCPLCYLPPRDVVELCQDKNKLSKRLGDGLSPKTLWVRDIEGAGGSGSQMASEYLPGRNVSCEMVFKDGAMMGYFQKERISYLVKRREPNVWRGIGSSAVSKCIDEKKILELSYRALDRITDKPHGVFGIDFRENEWGDFRITEINAGRFLTASYVYYYKTGYNLPKRMVQLALGMKITPLADYPEGIGVIRQIDQLPYCGEI